jgi:tetratricopeptide (TPR) repeat protein
MAPEQARGDAVDQRADIYATGLIMYDLITGKRRAGGAGSALDQLRARMEAPLPAIASVAPDVPAAVAEIITRATDPDVAKRFQTTEELAAALDRLDDNGVPKPVRRAVSLPIVGAVVAVLLAVSGGAWWYARKNAPPVVHDPVSVVIADFENRTGDPSFDRTLEPMVRRALEGAGFITAFDRSGIRRTVGVALPEKLDEAAAREIALKQGLGIVLSGAVERQGSGFAVSMKAAQTVTGEVVSEVRTRASGPDKVLPAATSLVSSVRKDLGDESSQSNPIFAMTSLSASSLDVVKYYAQAMDHTSNNQFQDAREDLLSAVKIDPSFGVGYLVLASVSRNMGRMQDALDYINQAMSHLDGMTEREVYTTRGMYYRLTGDYQQCVKEHSELISRYEADVIGHNQLALCASQLRDLTRARDEMRKVVELLPKRTVFRDNLALYANYASDFEEGEKEARTVIETAEAPDPFAFLALGLAQTGQGKWPEAIATYGTLATMPGAGPTLAASGLGDLAIVEGRYSEAAKILATGAADDLAAKNPDRAAAKFAAQAYALLRRGQKAAAVAAADKALANSTIVKIRFLAGRIYVEAGRIDKTKPLIESLSAEIQPEPQAYGKILEAIVTTTGKDARPAIKLLEDANTLLDTWIGHFELGRVYVATGQFPQADSEFDRCVKRRGEALALFLDEEPTYGYFPMVYYYQGRAREGMKLGSAAESYRAYLALREKAGEDPLLADLRRRTAK